MKRCWILVFLGLLLLPGGYAGAAGSSIELDNYYYAHANQPGTYVLGDKYGHTTLNGDYSQDDAYILQIEFGTRLGPGKINVTTREGYVFQNASFPLALGDHKSKSVKIEWVKDTYDESYAAVSWFTTEDASYSAGALTYIFRKGNAPGDQPTWYGDLGKGSPTPSATPNATATPTVTAAPTPTPTPTPQVGNLMAYRSGDRIVWQSEPSNTSRIDVYKDGVKVSSVPAGAKYYNFPDPADVDGDYVLKAVSTQGNVIAKTELIINGGISTTPTPGPDPTPTPTPTDPGGGPEQPTCTAGCQNIKDMLACPDWDKYMGEWADMIRSVIPPPPDWDMVADKIGAATINHLAAWAGSVPAPPTKEEINNETMASLPGVDTSVETDGLVPQVPGDYNNGPVNFDLSKDAPTIQIKDESQPFTISDPLADMPHDAPGVKVIPGDPKNSTGGFKTPDHVDTGDPAPTPGKVVFDLPVPSAPVPASTSGPPPTPGKIVFDLPPIPGSTSSVVPTPGTVNGIIPIPKGGE